MAAEVVVGKTEASAADDNNNNNNNDHDKVDSSTNNMKDRKVSWAKLRRVDSLNLEAGRVSFPPTHHANSQVRPSFDSHPFVLTFLLHT